VEQDVERQPWRSRSRSLVRAAVGIAISVVCLAVVVRGVDPAQTAQVVAGADWRLVALAAALIVADIGLRAYRWRLLLRPVAALPYPMVLRHTAIGYLANNVLPARLGEVTRSVTLGREADLSRSTVFGTVLVERVLDTAALAILATVAVLALGVHGAVEDAALAGLVLALALAVVLGVAIVARAVPLPAAFGRAAQRVPAVTGLLVRLHDGILVASDRRALGGGIVTTAASWLLGIAAWTLVARSLGVELDLGRAMLVMAGVSLATAIPSGPGYLGSFELATVTILAAFGVAAEPALAVAILFHAMVLAVTSLAGAIALTTPGIGRRLHRRRTGNGPTPVGEHA
jgi:hypothetical protein